jgi:hypothetical protein
MKVMIPSGVGMLSVAISGMIIIPVRIPPWMRSDVRKVPKDLAVLPSGVSARSNNSFLGTSPGALLGAFFATAFGAPFGRL